LESLAQGDAKEDRSNQKAMDPSKLTKTQKLGPYPKPIDVIFLVIFEIKQYFLGQKLATKDEER
jgi:hypothetical protein